MRERLNDYKTRMAFAWWGLHSVCVRYRTGVLAVTLPVLTLVLIVLAVVLPHRARYYTDNIGVRQQAREALRRIVIWETPQQVEASFNRDGDVYEPVVSRGNRQMVFTQGRAGSGANLFMSRYEHGQWQLPASLDALNTDHDELGPELSADGNYLYFYSDRPGGLGGYDLWVARWDGTNWVNPVNLGKRINSSYNEYGPALAAGDQRLFFTSNRPRRTDEIPDAGGTWQATLREQGKGDDYDIFLTGMIPTEAALEQERLPPLPAFRIPARVDALNSPLDEGQVALPRRGDFIYFSSNRKGGYGGFDLYRSRLRWDAYDKPQNLGGAVNSDRNEMDPTLHMEGFGLYFSANRNPTVPENYRLFQTLSREVTIGYDFGLLSRLWASIIRLKWWLLAMVAAVAAILFLLHLLGNRRLQQALLGRCILGSVLIHAVLLFLLSLWIISSEMIKSMGEPAMQIDMNALAKERLSVQIREEITELPPSEDVLVTAPQLEHMPVPELQPMEPSDKPIVEVADQTEAFMTAVKPVVTKSPPEPPLKASKIDPLAMLPDHLTVIRMEERPPEAQSSVKDTPVHHAGAPQNLQQIRDPISLTEDAAKPPGTIHESATEAPLEPLASVDTMPEPSYTPPHKVHNASVTNLVAMQTFQPTLAMDVKQAMSSSDAVADAAEAVAAISPEMATEKASQSIAMVKVEHSGRAKAVVQADISERTPIKEAFDHREGEVAMPPLAGIQTMPSMQLPSIQMASRIKLDAPQQVDSPYLLRRPDQRAAVLDALGGDAETEATVKRALDWLTRNQETDGRWDIARHGGEAGHDVAATSFALLCYLGWGTTHEQGEHAPVVEKGLKWLLAAIEENGGLPGNMYDQGIGTMALTEAYGLTKDPALLEPARRAVAFIANAQHANSGGWRYKPNERGDTSVFGWQYMALKSASMADVADKQAVMEKGQKWLDHVAGGKHGGLFGYQQKGQSKRSMPPEGMFCRQLAGMPPSRPAMQETARYLKANLPTAQMSDFYFWYYGTLALYQHQGPIWHEWNDNMKPILLHAQHKTGSTAGSWSPQGKHSDRMGRVVVTAMATLTLEVYYRYLPLYGFSGSPMHTE